ncbi:MAG TPA: ABC transporter permease [Thermomicrobiales bacterium]|nr:ABC transporter permease [Thermomicrobiales bacterium]
MNATLTQMKHSARNLVAVSLAITIGVAFVAATFQFGSVLQQTIWNSVAAPVAGSDIIITADGGRLDGTTLTRVNGVDGVATAEGRQFVGLNLKAGTRQTTSFTTSVPTTEAIRDRISLTDGRLPAKPGELVVVKDMLKQFDVRLGSTVSVTPLGGDGAGTDAATPVTIVGVMSPVAFRAAGAPDMYAWPSDLAKWLPTSAYVSIMVTTDPGTRTSDVIARLNAVLGGDAVVRSYQDYAEAQANHAVGSADVITTGLLAFAFVVLFVAGIVIGNTFTILVTQRVRQLALLRCIGATKAQVRRSVLTEAFVLALIASVIGVALGLAVVAGGVRLYGAIAGTSVIATSAPVPATAYLVPPVLGIVATLIAAWMPARSATRVAPLDALRPTGAPVLGSRTSRARIIWTLLLLGFGCLLLAGGVVLATNAIGPGPLAVGVGGGIISALGVLIGAVLIVPRTVRLIGALAGRLGAPGAIALSNIGRNPRRTTATAVALLIAVTLVTMMSVGTASMKTTLGKVIDERDPIDIVVSYAPTTSVDPNQSGLPDATLTTVTQTLQASGKIAQTMPVLNVTAWLEGMPLSANGVDPATALTITHAPDQLTGLADGTAIVPEDVATAYGIVDGDTLSLTVPSSGAIDVTAHVTSYPGDALIMTTHDATVLDPPAIPSQVWASFTSGTNAGRAVGSIQDSLANVGGISFSGGAESKQSNDRILDTILLIVTALLGVAVIIALVGVGNTLSLSILERTRESAILRAMGLTRRQLRAMLAIEGVLISVVGAVLGIVLGTAYGLIGAVTLLGDRWGISLALPGDRIAEIVVVAIVAGLLASVLPARKALKVSPVAALAE